MNPKTKTALIVCSILSALLMMFGPLLIGGAVVGSIAGGLSSIENSGTTKTDHTDACKPADTVATASMGKLEGDTTAAKLADAFAKAGFSKEATAGMMGNVQWESGFRADAINEIGATGIMQWYPGSTSARLLVPAVWTRGAIFAVQRIRKFLSLCYKSLQTLMGVGLAL